MMKTENTEKAINADEIDASEDVNEINVNEVNTNAISAQKVNINAIDANQISTQESLELEERQPNVGNIAKNISEENTDERLEAEETAEETVIPTKQAGTIQRLFKNNAGIIILGAGIFFTATDNMIGPYMMGVGAAAVGFSLKEATESVGSLSTTDRNNQQL